MILNDFILTIYIYILFQKKIHKMQNSQIYNFKNIQSFFMINVDSLVELLLSEMIKVFVYLKTENIW